VADRHGVAALDELRGLARRQQTHSLRLQERDDLLVAEGREIRIAQADYGKIPRLTPGW
jgi:hypothetical protein